MDERERRIGLNEAVFREVNERLEGLNDAFQLVTESIVVVCECGDPSCIEQFRMPPAEYQRLRADPLLFVVRPGHESADVEEVVESHGDYDVIRKHEVRGIDELAESTAPNG